MAFNPPLVDNFTGSNGSIDNRVSSTGPIWAAPSLTGETAAAIVSNAIPSTLVSTDYTAVIDSQQYGPDVEVAIVITQLASSSRVFLQVLSNGYTTFPETYGNGNLYHLEILPGGGGAPGDFILHRDIGASSVEIISDTTFTGGDFNAPESVGLSLVEEATGTRLTVWRKIAGVWTAMGNVLDTNASRPSGQRYVGFIVQRNIADVVIVDDFMVQATSALVVAWYGAAG